MMFEKFSVPNSRISLMKESNVQAAKTKQALITRTNRSEIHCKLSGEKSRSQMSASQGTHQPLFDVRNRVFVEELLAPGVDLQDIRRFTGGASAVLSACRFLTRSSMALSGVERVSGVASPYRRPSWLEYPAVISKGTSAF